MSNSTQIVTTQNLWQLWYELTTGLHGRLMADALIGLTTSTGLQQIIVTTGGSMHVELQPSTEIVGYVTLSGGTLSAGTTSQTTAAGQLSTAACTSVLVQNDPDNTMDIFVGTSGLLAMQLVPGQALSMGVSNVGQVWVRASSGSATVNWVALAS